MFKKERRKSKTFENKEVRIALENDIHHSKIVASVSGGDLIHFSKYLAGF